MAAGADDVLEAAEVCADLDTALAGCRMVFGCTARRRSVAFFDQGFCRISASGSCKDATRRSASDCASRSVTRFNRRNS